MQGGRVLIGKQTTSIDKADYIRTELSSESLESRDSCVPIGVEWRSLLMSKGSW